MRNSDIVFRGKLAAHKFGRAVFSVDEQWKGNPGHRVEIDWREGNHGDCDGFWPEDLKVGNELLVFAIRAPSGVYKTSICLPTKLVGKAQTEFRDLGPGKPPLDSTEGSAPPWIWLAFIAGLAVTLSLLLSRRMRRRDLP